MGIDTITKKAATATDTPLISLVERDTDPNTGVKIYYLIQKSDSFIVYLDKSGEICWSTTEDQNYPTDYGMVIQQMKMLENLSHNLFLPKQRKKFNVLLGEAFARALDDSDSTNALIMFGQIEASIKQYGKQRLRTQYVLGSILTTVACIVAFCLSWFFRDDIIERIGPGAFTIMISSLCGGIGAFVSSFWRTIKFDGDITIPVAVYRLDGFLRIFYGCIAGLIMTIAIRSNMVLGLVNDSAELTLSLSCFFATMAGASESVIPSVIKKIEDKI